MPRAGGRPPLSFWSLGTAQWQRLSPEINNNVPLSWTILRDDFLVRKPAKETRSLANK